MTGRQIRLIAIFTLQCLLAGTPAMSLPPADNLPPDLRKEVQKSIDRGLAYLRSTQDADGGWTKQFGPAVTAIVANGFVADRGHGPDHEVVQRALVNLLRFEQSDGGIYERQQNLHNYQTSVVLSFLSALPGAEQKPRIARAQKFLTTLQYDDSESVDRKNPWFGGAGYNDRKRPDLSNTQMMLQALHDSGLSKSDPVYQRALVFISRCQLSATTNDQPYARENSDGGFIYSAAEGGTSKASEEVIDGRAASLRSYGSMTYAGFKSLIYCNVGRDDPRIKSAYEWIRGNYTLEQNPGMPDKQAKQGLYYYYNVFAKSLDAWGDPVVIDTNSKPHNWRIDLCKKVISLQRKDGSWINDADRWLEGDPAYVTGLTIQTLQTAMK